MKDTLILRFTQSELSSTSIVSWVLFDPEQRVLGQADHPLQDIAKQAELLSKDFNIHVIVPSDSVLITSATIPSKQVRQIKQALPFMVEEQLADDIEAVHLAIPTTLDLSSTENQVPILVVKHDFLINWLDCLHEAQLSPTAMTADLLCVPHSLNTASALIDEQKLLLRLNTYSGSGLYLNGASQLIGAFLSDSNEQALQLLASGNDASSEEHLTELKQALLEQGQFQGDIKTTLYQESVIEILAATWLRHPDQTINLLQGGYGVTSSREFGQGQWRFVATAASISLIAYLLFAVGSGIFYNQKADQLEQDSIALYKSLFPGQTRVISPRKQMESFLRTRSPSTNANFLALLSEAAKPFLEGGSRYGVNQIRYDNRAQDLQIEVTGRSIEDLDQLKQSLASVGMSVDINSAIEKDDSIVGKINIRSQQ